jgi:glycosyltransferase involved in cell wall biosynthesis
MKILFFTNNLFGKDGWSRYSLDLVSSLKKLNLDIVCLVSEKNNDIEIKQYQILRKPLQYFTFPIRIFFDLPKIKKIIKKEKPDIIHFLVEPYGIFSYFLKFNFSKFKVNKYKILINAYGTYIKFFIRNSSERKIKKVFDNNLKEEIKKNIFPNIFSIKFLLNFFKKNILKISQFIFNFLFKKGIRYFNKIIVISNYTKNILLKESFELKEKTILINNGIDLKNSSLQYPNNETKSIVFIGAISERKGVLEAVKSIKKYKEKYNSKFIFNIIGNNKLHRKYFESIKKFVEENNLSNNVKFLGVVSEEEKEKFLKNADLFVMLSKILDNNHFEGYGLVYLEANKYGVPVIGPNQGGPKDAIGGGYSGFQVDIFDFDLIADKINLILNNNIIDRKNCFQWAKENDIQKKSKEILKFYEDILKE